jgi:lysozyme
MNAARLKLQLVRNEGIRLKPYHDSVGKLTIGVGRNLDDVGITNLEAKMLLENDIERVESDLRVHLPLYSSLDDVRQRVLMDMAFNMGVAGLLGFQKMLAALAARDFATAKAEMLNSKWAKQVGIRAIRLAEMIETGQDPTT